MATPTLLILHVPPHLWSLIWLRPIDTAPSSDLMALTRLALAKHIPVFRVYLPWYALQWTKKADRGQGSNSALPLGDRVWGRLLSIPRPIVFLSGLFAILPAHQLHALSSQPFICWTYKPTFRTLPRRYTSTNIKPHVFTRFLTTQFFTDPIKYQNLEAT